MADADALYRDALAACEQGRIEDGVAILTRRVQLAPDQPRIHGLLGQALIASRAQRRRRWRASIARSRSARRPPACTAAAPTPWSRWTGARRRCKATTARSPLKPDSVNDWCNRGAVAAGPRPLRAGRRKLRPRRCARARFRAGALQSRHCAGALKRYEPALASLDRAIALAPGFADAHNNRANALDQLGRQADALAAVDRALAIEPAHRAALVTRAVILRKLGRSDEALASCDRALALQPDDPEALTVRGDVLIDLERFDEAIGNLRPDDRARPRRGRGRNGTRASSALASAASRKAGRSTSTAGPAPEGLVPRPYPQPRWTRRPRRRTAAGVGRAGARRRDPACQHDRPTCCSARRSMIVLEVEPRLVAVVRALVPAARR